MAYETKETMIRTELGFPIGKVELLPNGELGLQVKAGQKYDTVSIWAFLKAYLEKVVDLNDTVNQINYERIKKLMEIVEQ